MDKIDENISQIHGIHILNVTIFKNKTALSVIFEDTF